MHSFRPILISLCAGLFLTGATDVPSPRDFVRPARITFPEDVPYSPQKAALGKLLFYDARLSGEQNLSCASCHNPSFGWEMPVPRAFGAKNQPLARHTPTVENLAEAPQFFWDGRVDSLVEQARFPITHPDEMNSSMTQVVRRLSAIAEYRRYFDIAFPDTGLTSDTVLQALATFQRTLRSGWAPFDDWVEGDDDAISVAAKRGFDLFVGAADCSRCHSGWSFTDHGFHNIGLASSDIGRGLVDPELMYKFKTPGLRNIALRAPYMHNGSLGSLHDVMDHYRKGGIVDHRGENDLSELDHLTERDVTDLIAFLETLTAYEPHVTTPALPVD